MVLYQEKMHPHDADLVARLQALRQMHNFSQDEIAQQIGLKGRSQVSRVENGQRRLTAAEAFAWAEACDVRLDLISKEEAEVLALIRRIREERIQDILRFLRLSNELPRLFWRLLTLQIRALEEELLPRN